MKLTLLLLAVCCASIKGGHTKSSTTTTTTNEELLERAASQLARLSAFRRTREPQPQTFVNKVQPQDNDELYRRIVAEPPQQQQLQQLQQQQQQQTEDIIEAQKRIDELRASATQLLQDPRYQAMMQERIKRSFIGGIANKLVGGIVGAASGASRGIAGLSSSNTPSGYGSYGHSYETKFDIGDFAKAIINTLVQAIKAIGGGAIAGGGALVKGGGYLVSAKGQIISSAGNAISTLGKSIASSAIIASPKPVYGPPGYSYNHPSPHQPSHDLTYDGPPPSADAYAGPEDAYNAGHSSYASPSNDDGEDDDAGLLVVKETKPGHDEGHDDHPPTSPGHSSGPSLAALEESFGGPPKGPSGGGNTITKITGFLNSGAPTVSDGGNGDEHREEHVDYYPEHKDQQPPPSGHQSSHSGYESASPPEHNNDYQSYQSGGQIYDSYGTKVPPYSSQLPNDHDAHQTSHDYQSPAFQRIPESLTTHLELPNLRAPTVFKDLASFADYHHHGNAQQSEPLKIPILGSHQNSLENSHDGQVAGSYSDYGLPNYGGGGGAPTQHTSINLEIGGPQLLNPGYENYQLHNAMGFDRHIQHPAASLPLAGASPAILGLWRRFSRRRSGGGGSPNKPSRISKGIDIQRSVGYSLMNAKLTRI